MKKFICFVRRFWIALALPAVALSVSSAPLAVANITPCTREYAPVCGQLAQPSPSPSPSQPQTQTFANRCMMKNAGATWLFNGECPAAAPKQLAR